MKQQGERGSPLLRLISGGPSFALQSGFTLLQLNFSLFWTHLSIFFAYFEVCLLHDAHPEWLGCLPCSSRMHDPNPCCEKLSEKAPCPTLKRCDTRARFIAVSLLPTSNLYRRNPALFRKIINNFHFIDIKPPAVLFRKSIWRRWRQADKDCVKITFSGTVLLALGLYSAKYELLTACAAHRTLTQRLHGMPISCSHRRFSTKIPGWTKYDRSCTQSIIVLRSTSITKNSTTSILCSIHDTCYICSGEFLSPPVRFCGFCLGTWSLKT